MPIAPNRCLHHWIVNPSIASMSFSANLDFCRRHTVSTALKANRSSNSARAMVTTGAPGRLFLYLSAGHDAGHV